MSITNLMNRFAASDISSRRIFSGTRSRYVLPFV